MPDQNQDQQITGDDLSELHGIALQMESAGDPRAQKLWDFIAEQNGGADPNAAPSGVRLLPAQSDSTGPAMRPETAQFLNDLSGIGTGAFLDMRQAETPEYEDWRDGNFTPDGTGNYVSQEGQAYTDDELQRMHGVLSQQAGNPLVSSLFDGPKTPVADYMAWRNQNFDGTPGGVWEDEDGTLYTEQSLQKMFGDKSATQPSEENQSSQTASDDDQPELMAQNTSGPQSGSPGTGPSLDGSMKQAADFGKWRDQNFRRTNDGRWEGPDAKIYTDQELQGLYTKNQGQAKRGTPTQADIVTYIRQQADAYGIPQALALGLVNKESHFDPNQTGGLGEVGLFQIMPNHDHERHKDGDGNTFKMDIDKAATDWQYNVRVGLALLKEDYEFAQKNSPTDPIAATYAHYNAHNNWKGYRSLNSNVHDHVYGQWIVRRGQRIYVDGYMDFYRKWSER